MFHKSNTKNLKEGAKFFKLDDLKCIWNYREIRKNENTDYQIYRVHKRNRKAEMFKKEKPNKQVWTKKNCSPNQNISSGRNI